MQDARTLVRASSVACIMFELLFLLFLLTTFLFLFIALFLLRLLLCHNDGSFLRSCVPNLTGRPQSWTILLDLRFRCQRAEMPELLPVRWGVTAMGE
jgi:hypothetical protein